MRLPHGPRVYGSKLVPANLPNVTIKGVNVVRQINSKWAPFWNDWNWESWVKPSIDVSIAAGANLIKVTGSGINAEDSGFNYPSDATLQARIDQFIGYCQQQGVAVYWNLVAHPFYCFGAGGTSLATNLPAMQKVTKWVDAHPNVVAIDCCNEMNQSQPTTWASNNYTQAATDLTALVSGIRQVTSLPLTVSVLCQAATDITGPWMSAVAGTGIDFHDFHPYYSGATPVAADVNALRSASWYLGRYLIGEIGTSIAQTSGVQTTWTQNLGVMGSGTGGFGTVLFCAADYDTVSTGQFGLYDTSVHNGRSQLLTPFAAWPGKL